MADVIANQQPIVIDNGSGVLKAGFAGGEKPKVVFSSAVGRAKHSRVMIGGALESSDDVFVGKKMEEHRGAMRISYPMAHGVVESWGDMERVWRHVYDRDNLNVPPEEHPVLLTEATLNPYRNRQRCAETFFESLGAPAVFVAPQAILALYASGRTTGVVLDSGDGVTHCVPVYEGFAVRHAVARADIAGRDVTERLALLLGRAGCALRTSAEREVARQIKEEACYVAFDPAKEEDVRPADVPYKLPDGQVIMLGPERFRAPEVLFNPQLIGSEAMGAAECLTTAIARADMELRRALFASVVLSGGSTCLAGFGDRLLNEARRAAPRGTKIRIAAPPERRLSTWIGGSILASLSTFRTMWVTRAEYEEHGKGIMDARGL